MSAFADGFPGGGDYVRAFAPTGEPFIVIQQGIFESVDAAEYAARQAFDKYAADHKGVLYWRTRPEVTYRDKRACGPHVAPGWTFYMRLLISSKEVNHAKKEHNDAAHP
jgi:hypothetical protein